MKAKRRVANPVLPGDHPDPSVVRVGDDYYMVCSTFQYFPAVEVLHAKNLVDWRPIGHVIERVEQLDLADVPDSFGVFAPDISYADGKYWVVVPYYHGQPRCTNILYLADRPEGPYDNGTVLNHHFIDPSIFHDENGRKYLAFGGGWIHELAADGSSLIGEARQVWPGTGGAAPEAPHVIKRDGWYYLILAEGGTFFDHMVTAARSRSIWGPYEPCPYNPILKQSDPLKPIQKTGHGKLVQDQQGKWWFPHLGGRPLEPKGACPLGRETFLQPVTWTEDGWFVIGENTRPLEIIEVEGVSEEEEPAAGRLYQWEDTFAGERLDPSWEWVRQPVADGFETGDRGLVMACKPYMLLVPQPTLLLTRRWEHLRFRVETELGFLPMTPGEEAGLLLYRDTDAFVMLTIRNGLGQTTGLPFDTKRLHEIQEEQGLYLQVDRYENANRRILAQLPLPLQPGERIRLRMRVDAVADCCRMEYALPGEEEYESMDLEVPVSFLFPERAPRFLCFTAPRAGIFARGVLGTDHGQARFTRFAYREEGDGSS
ncbi:family 43 glycosylhydrolase [Paenibacillus sp. 1P07SE]|uniref:family 43 glycosylhydrolase n=1 Tax=Paenibacillus sp. 1P07SE TaxID=3132209 RepID=UPI0039A6EE8C